MRKQKNKKMHKIIFYLIFLGFFAFLGKNVSASQITEINVLGLVNKARIENGLKALEPNEKLFSVASDKAEDMIRNDYFAHTSPQGVTPWAWFKKEEYDYKFAGENLAVSFSSAEAQQKAWMKSESHRKNILDPNFQEIGLAVKKGIINGELTTITVQEFGTQLAYVDSQNIKDKNNGPVAIKNHFSKLNESLLQNFNENIFKAREGLTGSVMSARSNFDTKKAAEYLKSGTKTVALTIIIVNTLIIFWIIAGSFINFKNKKEGLPAKFNLYNISQNEYLEFLEKFSVSPEEVKILYLKQGKLHRQKS